MPTSVVDISLSASTGATAKPTYNDIVVIGHATAAPNAGFNNATPYSSPGDVEDDFGAGSDVLTASEALAEMGVEEWYAVQAEELAITGEVIGDSDTSSVDSGTVQNTPMHDDPSTVTIYLDGTELTATPKTVSPPDANESPEAGEAFYNTDTGEIVTGDTSGGSSSGIEVDYNYLDWGSVKTAIQSLGLDVFTLADTQFGRAGVGNLSELVSYADSVDGAVVGASVNGNDVSSEQEAMDIAHEVGGYVPSGSYLQIAHKSGEDVASYVAGQLGVNRPWFDPFWDGDGYPFATEYYSRSLVGDPGSAGTFEGGDQANQAGATNVIISVDGTQVLSNSLTTAGVSSNYRYFDVGRTESFIASEVQNALKSLRLKSDQIPYTQQGRSLVLGTIRGELQEYVNGRGSPLSSVKVTAPTIDQITDTDKANRTFPNLTVEGTLAGNVHEFSVALNIRV